MASVTPAWSSVAAVPVWVSRVPHSGDEVGTGAALALNESARARPARARAAAIATLTLVTLRVRLRTATARNSLAVLQIGRASCRERVEISVVAVSLKKKVGGRR